MGQLKIHKVHYEGKTYNFSSPPLDEHKVNIIEAPNGSGKSTLFDLIYYSLGGRVSHFNKNEKVTHKEIVSDSSNFVELEISANGNHYRLVRKIGENLITIFSKNDFIVNGENTGNFACLAINRHRIDDYIFSDWLLNELNIPAIEIFHSGKNFKIGFNDLLRLIYHNQGTDANVIYKPADHHNHVSDSVFLRKAIFEVLIGKTLVQLYDAYGVLKRKQSNYDKANVLYNEYYDIVNEMHKQLGINEVINDNFLKQKINSLASDIDRLIKFRNNSITIKNKVNNGITKTEKLKEEFSSSEIELIKCENLALNKYKEIDSINDIITRTKEDARRIEKIIHTHKQLEMFTPDTCPYCLKHVDRPSDKCVCGNEIDENDYRRYFYDPSEYYSLLKSKIKSLETMKIALKSSKEELANIHSEIEKLRTTNSELKNELSNVLDNLEYITDLDAIDEVEDHVIEKKEQISNLKQALILEERLQNYQDEKNTSKIEMDKAKLAVEKLEASAAQELIEKIKDFSKYYNKFMKLSLPDCRSAEISSDDYMPLINNGDYKEASANVHKRFLYFVTLLQMSLVDDIPFPRLLLIDTPENIGIDNDNLKRMIGCLDALENPNNLDYQVILSTGVKKYPDVFKGNVILQLSKANKLLKQK
ncbi:hypothetical protein [Enterobacter mori]|uniref:hypothetical protein n=1 Tax=Enterobacter mori TaxID=539813 RepID=UPI00223667C1|nr:hypothetical protein [Enterobacter mori]MCW4989854.1 hypothetical protein [Enterobacter mori]